MTTSFINLSNGESIHYFEINHENINKRPTLYFIHGNISSWIWWSDTINVLKHFGYHIIAVDQRGFGASTYKTKCAYFGDWAKDLV
jgi:pimeloyl-ACP methyl ester carboxylesterase